MKSDGYRDANDVASQYVSPKLACLPIPAVAFAQSVGEDCVRMQPLITKAGTPRCFCGLAQGKTGEQNAVLFFRAVGSLARGAAKPARWPPTHSLTARGFLDAAATASRTTQGPGTARTGRMFQVNRTSGTMARTLLKVSWATRASGGRWGGKTWQSLIKSRTHVQGPPCGDRSLCHRTGRCERTAAPEKDGHHEFPLVDRE